MTKTIMSSKIFPSVLFEYLKQFVVTREFVIRYEHTFFKLNFLTKLFSKSKRKSLKQILIIFFGTNETF